MIWLIFQPLVSQSNAIGGTVIAWDSDRMCYGLKAERRYLKGDIVTTYGGRKYSKEVEGDYVAKAASDVHIDGRVGFHLSEKGLMSQIEIEPLLTWRLVGRYELSEPLNLMSGYLPITVLIMCAIIKMLLLNFQ